MSTGENLEVSTIAEIMKYSQLMIVGNQMPQVRNGPVVYLKDRIVESEFFQIFSDTQMWQEEVKTQTFVPNQFL